MLGGCAPGPHRRPPRWRSNGRPVTAGRHGSDRSHAGGPHPRGRRAHVRARGIGAARRLGRRGRQDRTRGARRRHAGPGVERAGGHGHERPRPAGALQPGQAEPGPRPDVGGWPGHPLPAGGEVRRLPHQQAPWHPVEAAHRRRRHPGAQPPHHLRAWQRPGRAWPRDRPRLLRHARLLVPRRHRHGHEAGRLRLRARATGAGVRRLDRRHDHRRRDHGRVVPPRAHRRGDHGRRVPAGHRHVVDGRGPGTVAPAQRGVGPAAAALSDGQPARARRTPPRTGSSWRSRASRRRGTGPRCAV